MFLERAPFDLSFDDEIANLAHEKDKLTRRLSTGKNNLSLPSVEQLNIDNASLVSSIISSDDSIRDKIGSVNEPLSLMEPTILKQNSVMKRSSREQIINKFNDSK